MGNGEAEGCQCCSGKIANIGQHVRDRIRANGWTTIGVTATREMPGWAYTIGLVRSYDLPEMCVFGLPAAVAQSVLTTAVDVARKAPLSADSTIEGILGGGYLVTIESVHSGWVPRFFAQALYFYREHPRMLQLVWPNKHGQWPWQAPEGDPFRSSQPTLNLGPAFHPASVWTHRHGSDSEV